MKDILQHHWMSEDTNSMRKGTMSLLSLVLVPITVIISITYIPIPIPIIH